MKPLRVHRLTPAFAALLPWCLPAHAEPSIVLVSQDRSAVASANITGPAGTFQDSDQDAAPDFGPFEATASASVKTMDGSSGGYAAQDSTVTPEQIVTEGSANFYFIVGDAYAYGLGVSRTSVTFTVPDTMHYAIHGTLQVDSALARVRLTGPQGVIHEVTSFFGSRDVSFSGTLAVGQYTLEVRSDAQGGNGDPGIWHGGSAHHAITMTFGSSPPSGEVPDGDDVPGEPLRAAKLPGDVVHLTWGPSCRVTDNDYAVYEAPLNDPLALVTVTCSTSGATSYDFASYFDSSIFLVVPHNDSREGSYGRTSLGDERSPGASACWTQFLGATVCP